MNNATKRESGKSKQRRESKFLVFACRWHFSLFFSVVRTFSRSLDWIGISRDMFDIYLYKYSTMTVSEIYCDKFLWAVFNVCSVYTKERASKKTARNSYTYAKEEREYQWRTHFLFAFFVFVLKWCQMGLCAILLSLPRSFKFQCLVPNSHAFYSIIIFNFRQMSEKKAREKIYELGKKSGKNGNKMEIHIAHIHTHMYHLA